MNEEILRLIATADFSGAISAVNEWETAMKKSMSNTGQKTRTANKAIIGSVDSIMVHMNKLSGKLKEVDREKHFVKLIQDIKLLKQEFKHLITPGVSSRAIKKGFYQEIKAMKGEIGAEAQLGFKGVSLERYAKRFKEIEESIKKVRINSKQWVRVLVTSAVELNKIRKDSEKIRITIKKMIEDEKKITVERRAQKEEAKVLLQSNKDLVSITGVVFDRTSGIFIQYKKMKNAIEDLIVEEKHINIFYDKEIQQKKKTIALMIKQGISNEIIKASTKDVLNLEKTRNRELTKIKNHAMKIKEIMTGVALGGKGTKEARAAMRRLAKSYEGAAKSASFLGLKTKALSADTIRLGGATTGMFRVLSRWRNRILVTTFAIAGLVRGMKRWIDIAVETEKKTVALTMVATNLGLGTLKLKKAIYGLAEDGIFSINAITVAMKNFLAMGADFDLTVQAIDTFKDSSLAAGKAGLSLDEMLITASGGFLEFRSQVTDNIGVMKNLNDMLKENPKLIKEVGIANTLLIVAMREAGKFEGVRAKILETLSGRLGKLKTATLLAKIELGEFLKPIASKLVLYFMDNIQKLKGYVQDNILTFKVFAATVGDAFISAMELLKLIGIAFAKVTPSVAWFVEVLGKAVETVTRLSKKLPTLTQTIMSFGIALLFAKKIMVAFGLTAMALFSIPGAILVGILGALAFLSAQLIKIYTKKKELIALDKERIRLSKELTGNYEDLKKVLTSIKEIKEKEKKLDEIGTLKDYFDILKKIVEKRKELAKPVAIHTLAPTVGLGAVMQKIQLRKDIKHLEKMAKLIEETYGEALKYLKDMGFEIDIVAGKYIQYSREIDKATGKQKILAQGSIKDLETLLEILEDMDRDMQAIPKLAVKVRTFAAQAVEKMEALRVETEAIDAVASKSKLLTLYRDYVKGVRRAKDADEDYRRHMKKLNEGIKTRTEYLERQLLPLEERAKLEKALTKVIRDKTIAEKDYIDLLKLEGAYSKKLFKGVISDLKQFGKSIEDIGSKMGETFQIVQQRIEDVRYEIGAIMRERAGGFVSKMAASIRSATRSINMEILKSQQQYVKTYDELNLQIGGYKEALEKILKDEGEAIKSLGKKEEITKQITKAEKELTKSKLAEVGLEKELAILKSAKIMAPEKKLMDIMDIRKIGSNYMQEEDKSIEELNRKLRVRQDISKGINLNLESQQAALEKINIYGKGREESLLQIGWAELEIFILSQEQIEAEERLNDLLKERIKLITQMEYDKLMEDLRKTIFFEIPEGRGILSQAFRAFMQKGKLGIEKAEFKKRITEMMGMKDITEDMKTNLEAWHALIESGEHDFWMTYGNIIMQGTQQVLNTLINFGFQYSQGLRSIEESRWQELAALEKQLDLGLILEEDFATKKQNIKDKSAIDEKVYRRQQVIAIADAVKQTLAAMAVEYLVQAMAHKVISGSFAAAAAEATATGNPIIAAKLLGESKVYATTATGYGKAAAIMGGAAAIGVAAGAAGFGKAYRRETAEMAGAAGVEYGAGAVGGVGATTTPQGRTYGTTIQGQPQTVTINPAIHFYGDYLFLGDTVEMVGEKMGNVIVEEIKDAMGEGEFSEFGIG